MTLDFEPTTAAAAVGLIDHNVNVIHTLFLEAVYCMSQLFVLTCFDCKFAAMMIVCIVPVLLPLSVFSIIISLDRYNLFIARIYSTLQHKSNHDSNESSEANYSRTRPCSVTSSVGESPVMVRSDVYSQLSAQFGAQNTSRRRSRTIVHDNNKP